jgi:hypothetical protein
MATQNYAVIAGHGRTGTNWLLDIFDASSHTFCRNEPDMIQGSPCEQLAPLWRIDSEMPDMEKHWDAIAAWMGSRMGERDHHLVNPKEYVHSFAQMTGVAAFPVRPKIRATLQTIYPPLRAGEWKMPWWVGDPSRLQQSYAILKINQSARIAAWLLKHRPQVPVIHIVRHPGGRLNSWIKRFLSRQDEAQIDDRNKVRLRQVVAAAPEWGNRFGDIEAMSVAESETWFWRYVTESIHQLGQGRNQYKLVIYEDLAADPLGVAREIYEFCGLPFTPEVEAIIRRGLGNSVWGKIQGTPTTIAQAWRTKLDAREMDMVYRILDGSLMETWWGPQPASLASQLI